MDARSFEIHADLERSHWWFQARRQILRRVVDALVGGSCGKTIVDIGCSVGNNLAAFHPDYRAIGYDPSAEAVAIGLEHHPELDLRVGDYQAARAACSEADVVLLTDVIEHVADDRALLSRLVEGLRPGSLLVVTVPADMRLWSPHDEALGHFRRYDVPMLGRAMAFDRLRPLLVSHFNSRLFPAVRLARMFSRGTAKREGAAQLDIKPTREPLNGVLRRCFAGEARRLLGVIEGNAQPYRRGVSLMGVYQVAEGAR